jgi:hypothetical protein
MGQITRPQKVNLIIGLLAREDAMLARSKQSLVRAFGKIDYQSPILDFNQTDYYAGEMGEGLKRQFIGFHTLMDAGRLWRSKVKSNRIEERLSRLRSGKKTIGRKVNIDPGYLDLAKVVLFSTKDYTHRIYLRSGIFAEVTLFYKDKSFRPWPWTYPDYKTQDYISIFNTIRDMYKEKLR